MHTRLLLIIGFINILWDTGLTQSAFDQLDKIKETNNPALIFSIVDSIEQVFIGHGYNDSLALLYLNKTNLLERYKSFKE